MKQISQPDNLAKALNFKISNMNMNVIIKLSKLKGVISNSSWIDSSKLDDYTLPTFTKKIFNHLKKI
jgi:A/G-specific adenine glycosylase